MNLCKKVISVLLVIMMIGLLGACSKPKEAEETSGEKEKQSEEVAQEEPVQEEEEEPEPEPQEETYDLGGRVIKYLTANPNEDDPFHEEAPQDEKTEQRKQMLKAVEEKYNVKIEYVTYQKPFEERADEIMTSILAGDPIADIARVSAYWIPQLAAGDFLVPIDDIKGDMKIPQYSLDAGAFKGKHYGFDERFGGGDQGLFFNKRLVEEAGLENPTMIHKRGEWTYAKFLEWAHELKKTLPKDIYPVSMDPAYFGLFVIGSNGGTILDPDTSAVTFTTPAAIEAVEFLQQVYAEGLVMPIEMNAEGEKDYWSSPRNAFKQGKSVITHGHVWEAQYGYNNDMEDEWGYVPFPYGPQVDGSQSNYKFGVVDGARVMLKGTKDPDMVLKIWHDLIWNEDIRPYPTEEEAQEEYVMSIEGIFPEEESIEALLWSRSHAYTERITTYKTADARAYSIYAEALRGIAEEGLSVRSTLESITSEVEAVINQIIGQ